MGAIDKKNLLDKPCAWATPKQDGSPFWENGIYRGEDDIHYYFQTAGKMRIYLKSNVMRLEFAATPSGGVV